MFERFTDKARRVVVLAQEEVRLLRHPHIGTEHLLLGLVHEADGVGGQVLIEAGVDLATLRAEVERRIPPGPEERAGHIPFTPRAKKVLEFALRESIQFGVDYIGTEHILLAIVREGEGVAAQILISRGVMDTLRDAVMSKLVASGAVVDPGRRRESASLRAAARVMLSEPGARDIVVRLEAIEARLSAIEALLRAQGEEREAQ